MPNLEKISAFEQGNQQVPQCECIEAGGEQGKRILVASIPLVLNRMVSHTESSQGAIALFGKLHQRHLHLHVEREILGKLTAHLAGKKLTFMPMRELSRAAEKE